MPLGPPLVIAVLLKQLEATEVQHAKSNLLPEILEKLFEGARVSFDLLFRATQGCSPVMQPGELQRSANAT